jgi:hypothetical protein
LKKVGILTFHCANNYGAVLQTYALQTVISSIGNIQINVIDYRPIAITSGYKLFSLHSFLHSSRKVRYCVVSMYNLSNKFLRTKRFEKTRKDLIILDKYANYSAYDVLFCGSDQIWNPKITKGFDSYFFGFLPGFKGITASYAASLGLKTLSEEQKYELKKFLMNFEFLSVREKAMVPLLEPLVSIPVSVCLDPVLLLEKEQWVSIIKKPKINKYILIYRMVPDEQIIKDAYALASTTGCIVIEISYGKRIMQHVKHKVITTAGPSNFLGLFYHAEYVLTNSFHGTSFSILFNKQFCSYHLDIGSDRITDLLKQLKIYDRYVINSKDVILERIDWKLVNESLASLRKESLAYIQTVLNQPLKAK